ncbi:MAG: hypothetical protein AAF443_03695, partial [Chlamydiota bacterium]
SQKGYVDTFGSQATASRRKDHMLVSELSNNYTQGTLSSQSPKRDEDYRVSSLSSPLFIDILPGLKKGVLRSNFDKR